MLHLIVLQKPMLQAKIQCVEHMHNNYSNWDQKIYEASVKFLDVCVHDNRGEERFIIKEYVRLAEDFVLCEAMETKWSPEITHKCSCPRASFLLQRTVQAYYCPSNGG
jgi:hypothetical protein